MRGKPGPSAPALNRAGLIPACAGKTRGNHLYTPPCPAHPRVCGENMACWPARVSVSGSSPRVRRKRHERHVHARVPRLIPACAGKTVWVCAAVFGIPAYPRVCGENHSNSNDVVFSFGSSPRVRGKLCGSPIHHASQGLIPACAGKTFRAYRSVKLQAAHPRVCGENSMYASTSFTLAGSSPRVRGKHGCRIIGAQITGLIPACAGKT